MNTIPPAYQSGLSGIQTGLQNLNKNSATLASTDAFKADADAVTPLTELMKSEQQVETSAKILEASNAMMGSILDIKV
jgi:hypothetical protein